MSEERKRKRRSPGSPRPEGQRPVGSGYARVRLGVLDRDGWVCQRCRRVLVRAVGDGVPKSHAATVDHVIPVVRGGWDDPVNLQALCLACNVWKGDRVMDFRPPRLRVELRAARKELSIREGREIGAWFPGLKKKPYGPIGRNAHVLSVRLPAHVAEKVLTVHPSASQLLRAAVEGIAEIV